jgi:hypothetical protein
MKELDLLEVVNATYSEEERSTKSVMVPKGHLIGVGKFIQNIVFIDRYENNHHCKPVLWAICLLGMYESWLFFLLYNI